MTNLILAPDPSCSLEKRTSFMLSFDMPFQVLGGDVYALSSLSNMLSDVKIWIYVNRKGKERKKNKTTRSKKQCSDLDQTELQRFQVRQGGFHHLRALFK